MTPRKIIRRSPRDESPAEGGAETEVLSVSPENEATETEKHEENGRFIGSLIDDELTATGSEAPPAASPVETSTEKNAHLKSENVESELSESQLLKTENVESELSKPTQLGHNADKDAPRDVTPNPRLAIFIDAADKNISNKKRKNYLNKGGMFFNERDLLILQLVAAHGWLSLKNISELTVSKPRIWESLRRLVTHQLLDNHNYGHNGETLYTLTSSGNRKIKSNGFHSNVTPRTQTLEHTDAITSLHIHLMKRSQNSNNFVFLTERELQATITSGELPNRVTNQSPWTNQYKNFKYWAPSTINNKGEAVYKRPDGLLLTLKEGIAQPPMPVEIERTLKGKADYYQNSTIMYANAAKNGHLSDTVYYFCPSWDGTLVAVSNALADVYTNKGGFNYPINLPKINYEVEDLDKCYTPFAIKRGWSGLH